jgi:hypothetical protein
MISPAIGASRFAAACLLGIGLGLWYGFLRPLRPRHTCLSDGLFLLGFYWVWLYHGFGICRGDLRLGDSLGLILGTILWDSTAGRLLRPLFSGFWKLLSRFRRLALYPWKKIFKKAKILFALAEKWVTIRWNNRRQNRYPSGGVTHGRTKKIPSQSKIRPSSQHTAAEDRCDSGYLIFYGSAAGYELGPQQHPGTDRGYAAAGRGTGIRE